MGSLCGGTNTTTTVNQPPQQVLDAYGRVVNRAEQVSNTPLQQYQGNQVAGFTPTQDAAFGRINTAVDAGAPYLDSARGYATAATAPVAWGPGALAPYMSPYHDAVVEATMANMDRNNAIQDQRIVGDAIKSGAWGGDRVDVARAELARAQGLAGAKTFADLNAANYGQAMGQFNTVDAANAARAQQGAYTFGQLGQLAQGQGLQGAGAMLGAGNLQQQLEQARLNVPLQQFMEARAYPFQTTQFLSGITTGLGSQMGGSSATTAPAPSMLQQLGGLGIAGVGLAGLLMSDGRAKGGAVPIGKSFSGDTIYRYHYHGDPETTHVGMIAQEVEQRDPGAVHDIGGVKFLDYDRATAPAAREGFALGGAPYGGGGMYGVPDVPMTMGRGLPPPPPAYQDRTVEQLASQAMSLAGMMKKGMRRSASPKSREAMGEPTGIGELMPYGMGASNDMLPPIYSAGGVVLDMAPDANGIFVPRGYAMGGRPSFGDYFTAPPPSLAEQFGLNPDGSDGAPPFIGPARMFDVSARTAPAPSRFDTTLLNALPPALARQIAPYLPNIPTAVKEGVLTGTISAQDAINSISDQAGAFSGVVRSGIDSALRQVPGGIGALEQAFINERYPTSASNFAQGMSEQRGWPTLNPDAWPTAQQAQNSRAADLIRGFEGFRSTPYWDVNALRIGYGSDTITDPVTGQVRRVREGDTVTREMAEADLARRIPEFQDVARRAVPNFDQLPQAARDSLTSMVYNYGRVPPNVAAAAATGDPGTIAAAIEARAGDNRGINAERRASEAAHVLAGQEPTGETARVPSVTPPPYVDSFRQAQQQTGMGEFTPAPSIGSVEPMAVPGVTPTMDVPSGGYLPGIAGSGAFDPGSGFVAPVPLDPPAGPPVQWTFNGPTDMGGFDPAQIPQTPSLAGDAAAAAMPQLSGADFGGLGGYTPSQVPTMSAGDFSPAPFMLPPMTMGASDMEGYGPQPSPWGYSDNYGYGGTDYSYNVPSAAGSGADSPSGFNFVPSAAGWGADSPSGGSGYSGGTYFPYLGDRFGGFDTGPTMIYGYGGTDNQYTFPSYGGDYTGDKDGGRIPHRATGGFVAEDPYFNVGTDGIYRPEIAMPFGRFDSQADGGFSGGGGGARGGDFGDRGGHSAPAGNTMLNSGPYRAPPGSGQVINGKFRPSMIFTPGKSDSGVPNWSYNKTPINTTIGAAGSGVGPQWDRPSAGFDTSNREAVARSMMERDRRNLMLSGAPSSYASGAVNAMYPQFAPPRYGTGTGGGPAALGGGGGGGPRLGVLPPPTPQAAPPTMEQLLQQYPNPQHLPVVLPSGGGGSAPAAAPASWSNGNRPLMADGGAPSGAPSSSGVHRLHREKRMADGGGIDDIYFPPAPTFGPPPMPPTGWVPGSTAGPAANPPGYNMNEEAGRPPMPLPADPRYVPGNIASGPAAPEPMPLLGTGPSVLNPGAALAYAGDDDGGYHGGTAEGVDVSAQSRVPRAAPEAGDGRPAWALPLMAAGFGMMASKSPHPGVALGEGGLHGIAAFNTQEKQRQAEAKSRRDERRLDLTDRRDSERVAQGWATLKQRQEAAQAALQDRAENRDLRREEYEERRIDRGADREVRAQTAAERTEDRKAAIEARKEAERIRSEDRAAERERREKTDTERSLDRQESVEQRRQAAERSRWQYLGPDKDNPGHSLFLDQRSPDGEVVSRPANVEPKPGAGGKSSATQQIIGELRKENPDLTYADALALTKRAPNADQAALRKEALALSAAKADLKYMRDPDATIERYRKKYGLGATAPAPAAAPGAAPAAPAGKEGAGALPPQPKAVPPGSAYSPSRKMWKAPDGRLFDESGSPVQ